MVKTSKRDTSVEWKRTKKVRDEIPKKVKKIKKENPNLTETDINRIVDEEKQRIFDKYKIQKGYDYLDDTELIILDAVLTNKNKRELAKQLNLSLSGVYYKISTTLFQKALQSEMMERYNDMKKARKTLYTKIAEKALNILLTQLEEIEKDVEKRGFSYEKTKDVMAIAEKIISLMQEEDGGKTTNLNVSGGMQNTNMNVNADMKDFDLADQNFRLMMAQSLAKTQIDNPTVLR